MGNGEGVLAGVLFVLFGIPILFVVCAVVFSELKQDLKEEKERELNKKLGIDLTDTSDGYSRRSRRSNNSYYESDNKSNNNSSSWGIEDDFHWHGLL